MLGAFIGKSGKSPETKETGGTKELKSQNPPHPENPDSEFGRYEKNSIFYKAFVVLIKEKCGCLTTKRMKRILVAEPEQAVSKKAFAN